MPLNHSIKKIIYKALILWWTFLIPTTGMTQISIFSPKTIVGFNSEDFYGLQFGIYNKCKNGIGLQTGLMNNYSNTLYGLQIGIWNTGNSLYGIKIGLLNSNCFTIHGISLGLLNKIKKNRGISIGIANYGINYFMPNLDHRSRMGIENNGVQFGCLNSAFYNNCIQFGGLNYVYENSSIQFGLINLENHGDGIQIGIINYRKRNIWWAKVLPIINFKIGNQQQ